jgi:Asp-tRNA(Asn)/Glu-tRNA(Gln) amidotransferase A subunit family amidase
MPPDRRALLRAAAALGVGSVTFQRALAAQAPDAPAPITPEMVRAAEWVAGITLTEAERKRLAGSLTAAQKGLAALRAVKLPNAVPPAFQFNPAPGLAPATQPRGSVAVTTPVPAKPAGDDGLAFLPLAALAGLVRTKQVSSVELTKLYLARLHKYDPLLKCVVTFLDEYALEQAKAADADIAAGNYRGPLHGIPWGAKDLIAYDGFPTTWGAEPYKGQTLADTATVAKRLDDAGAVLAAKLTLGALALGDKWFGGMTRNPWNPVQGSSGSSAGSASAVVAGLCGFTVGSETLGSIVSPSTRCGATGLRPTFGRVSRAGCMTLSWTMDKLGPICRTVEDCALVFGSIHGADPADPTSVDRPFTWPSPKRPADIRVGYVLTDKKPVAERSDLTVLKDLGFTLVDLTEPVAAFRKAQPDVGRLLTILDAESAAAFDDLTRAGVRDGIGPWPATFQKGQFVTAVEYIRANRLRTLVMRDFEKVVDKADVLTPFAGDLVLTNLTGHPQVCLPNGFTKAKGVEVPTAITFVGRLFGEGDLLSVAHAYQLATGHHLKHPPLTPPKEDDK